MVTAKDGKDKQERENKRVNQQIKTADAQYRLEQLAGLHPKNKDPMLQTINPLHKNSNPMNRSMNERSKKAAKQTAGISDISH
jgi:hypothetical protein